MNKRNPDFAPAIARMRQIAAEAADHLLLGDGPPCPDAELLDVCAETLSLLREGADAYAARDISDALNWTEADKRRDRELMARYNWCNGQATAGLRAAAKLKAATAAGIYAKAACVRVSRTGAAALAMSLAVDLLDNQALRRSLWPAA